jgi:hypothetical protein
MAIAQSARSLPNYKFQITKAQYILL